MTILPASTPPALRSLIRHCLEKDPKRRLRDIADARLAIDDVLDPAGRGPIGAGRRLQPTEKRAKPGAGGCVGSSVRLGLTATAAAAFLAGRLAWISPGRRAAAGDRLGGPSRGVRLAGRSVARRVTVCDFARWSAAGPGRSRRVGSGETLAAGPGLRPPSSPCRAPRMRRIRSGLRTPSPSHSSPLRKLKTIRASGGVPMTVCRWRLPDGRLGPRRLHPVRARRLLAALPRAGVGW